MRVNGLRPALILLATVVMAQPAWAQQQRQRGGGQGQGVPGGFVGGGQPQNGGGLFGGLFGLGGQTQQQPTMPNQPRINQQGGGFPGGMVPQGGGQVDGNGMFRIGGGNRNNRQPGNQGDPTTGFANQPGMTPNPAGAGTYMIDPATGQYILVAPDGRRMQVGEGMAPAAQPVQTQTRVYDASNRVFIQETGQYTGEMWDPASQRLLSAAEVASMAAAAAATAAKPAEAPKPPQKPPGPPRNEVRVTLLAADDAQRRIVRSEIQKGGLLAFLSPEVEARLQDALFTDARKDELLDMVGRKPSVTPEQLELLTRAVDDLDAPMVRTKLDSMEFARDQYNAFVEQIAFTRVYNELVESGVPQPARIRSIVQRLDKAAARAGVPRDVIRAAAEQIQGIARIYDELDVGFLAQDFDLAAVTPETVFTVVRLRGLPVSEPRLLSSETLLAPATGSTGNRRISIATATAWEVGLPICGANSLPLPDSGPNPAPPPSVLTLQVAADAGAELTAWINEGGQAVPHAIKPGAKFQMPAADKVQIAHLDGRGGVTAWEELTFGTYIFQLKGGLWSKQKAQTLSQVVFDNSANGFPFHYQMDGIESIVPARQAAAMNYSTATSVIQFHRGVGDQVMTKVLNGGQTRVDVRLGGAKTGLDLFTPDASTPALTSAAEPDARPRGAARSTPKRDEVIQARFPVGSIDE
ncbi:hypothetical protein [Paludisphaera rhizosphaerae]|uniref:hypothetical protein n=1 Tax=Paludisphaera rhizosphaerae TaxID=2711216 RepID=UPI0013EB5445|nr:hypothetical protein [Paludisphaera rhizosphaerae]